MSLYLTKTIKINKLTLKTQHRFTSDKNNFFNQKINNVALSANNDKTIQSVDSLETDVVY